MHSTLIIIFYQMCRKWYEKCIEGLQGLNLAGFSVSFACDFWIKGQQNHMQIYILILMIFSCSSAVVLESHLLG